MLERVENIFCDILQANHSTMVMSPTHVQVPKSREVQPQIWPLQRCTSRPQRRFIHRPRPNLYLPSRKLVYLVTCAAFIFLYQNNSSPIWTDVFCLVWFMLLHNLYTVFVSKMTSMFGNAHELVTPFAERDVNLHDHNSEWGAQHMKMQVCWVILAWLWKR